MLWHVDSPSVLPSPPLTEASSREEEEDQTEAVNEAESDAPPAESAGSAGDGAASSRPPSAMDALHSVTFKEWLKMSPVYLNYQEALNEIGYKLVHTPSYKNCCLLFAFQICSNYSRPIDEEAQAGSAENVR